MSFQENIRSLVERELRVGDTLTKDYRNRKGTRQFTVVGFSKHGKVQLQGEGLKQLQTYWWRNAHDLMRGDFTLNDPDIRHVHESVYYAERYPNSYASEEAVVLIRRAGELERIDTAWVHPHFYEKMDVYDSTVPTGKYLWKCWKRNDDTLGIYLPCDPPAANAIVTAFAPIQVMPNSAFQKNICACGHPHGAHGVHAGCLAFRCRCNGYEKPPTPF